MRIRGSEQHHSITSPKIRRKSEITFAIPSVDTFFPGLSGVLFPIGSSTLETDISTEIDGNVIESDQRFFYQFASESTLSKVISQDFSPKFGFISHFAKPKSTQQSKTDLLKTSSISVSNATLRSSENPISQDETLSNIKILDVPDTWMTSVKPACIGIESLELVSEGLPSLNQYLQTSVHLAVITGNSEILRYLVYSTVMSSYISTQDIFGCTPLHYAVQQDNPDLVHILLKGGSLLYIKDMLGLTPYQLAKSLGCERVLGLVNDGDGKPYIGRSSVDHLIVKMKGQEDRRSPHLPIKKKK